MQSVVVSSIAALRAVSQEDAQASIVLGYSGPGDGGGGTYWLNPADTTGADNGGTIIVAADGGRWYLRNIGAISAKQLGACGNGVTDDSEVFGTDLVASLLVPGSVGRYRIAANTTVTADLICTDGQFTVDDGVVLTINGGILAPSKVLFLGAGTVIINKGEIDVAWFDGADASSKTSFALRGVKNTNGTGKELVYKVPSPADSWATQSANSQWGYGWKVVAPIDLEQAQNYTMYVTRSSFIATEAMDSVFALGNGQSKADGQNFPMRLKVDGGNGLASWAVRSHGSSHLYIDYMEAYYCGGVALTPNGGKQCSDIRIGFIDTGELYNQAVLMDGSAGTNCTITDVEIGFVSSTGFVSGHAADSVVKIASNCNAVKIGPVEHRAVNPGFVDATEAVVLITNGGSQGSTHVSCRYGINIGPVTNGSLTQTAECVVTADATNGAAAKMTGITIEAGSQSDTSSPPGGSTISLNYTEGAIVQGLPAGSSTNTAQKVTVNSTCTATLISGMTPSQVIDAGVGTLINGHNYGSFKTVPISASPVSWTNTCAYDVGFALSGGNVTAVNIVRGSGVVSAYSGANLGCGIFPLAPGDNIQFAYNNGAAPVATVIPR